MASTPAGVWVPSESCEYTHGWHLLNPPAKSLHIGVKLALPTGWPRRDGQKTWPRPQNGPGVLTSSPNMTMMSHALFRGKGKSYPHLLNLMPPHETYIESHLGGGAVMRHKRAARQQIGIDIDPSVIAKWGAISNRPCEIVCADAVCYLNAIAVDKDTLIYADPPYLRSTRRRPRVYRYDYSDEDHKRLIACLHSKPCMVMLSGYQNELYERQLIGWKKVSFHAKTHADVREESVWMNFDPPSRLHDSNHLGGSFREREVIKRRRLRLQSRIGELSAIEQHSVLEWLQHQLKETT